MGELIFKRGDLDPEAVLQKVQSLDPAHNSLYKKQDDIATARLFADVFEEAARYNETARAWYIYTGIKWKKDPEGLKVDSLAKTLARALLIYAADQDDKSYVQYISRLQDKRKRDLMVKDSRDFHFITSKDLDQDPDLFNCQNGVINLRTHEFREHDPKDLLSKVSNVIYDSSIISQDWEQFMRDIMCNDIEKIEYLQQISGYALTGDSSQEECYMCYGATTRNGKSTFLDTLEYMAGDYAANIAPESLAMRERNSRNASGDIARLDGVRLLHCGEPPKRMKFDVALLKTFLGRDQITARNLYEAEFQFVPQFKLLINTNHLPVVTDDTLFSSGRVKVIPFNRHFSEAEQDRHLKSRLKSKKNISGIFNWALHGLSKYQDAGEIIVPPEAVIQATNEYREKSDKIKSFVSECLYQSADEILLASDVYESFQTWCRDNGYGTENRGNFYDELRNRDLLSPTGTVNGITRHNVVKGYGLSVRGQ